MWPAKISFTFDKLGGLPIDARRNLRFLYVQLYKLFANSDLKPCIKTVTAVYL